MSSVPAYPSTARAPRLRLVCVNDVYTLENLPRLRSLVEHHAETDPADVMLVTMAGDFVAPSLLSGLDAGRGMVDCLNAVGVTHACLGNHEDDIPTDELKKRIAEFAGVWLSTNVRGLDPRLVSRAIVRVGRVRVGLVGVVMDDAAAYRRRPFGGGEIEPPNDSAIVEATLLMRDERCACVIPMTHQSMANDRALAHAQRSPPFPIIVGGHEHTVALEEVEGTWIVKAAADAVHAVIVDLEWPIEAPRAPAFDLPTVRVRLDDVANYPENKPLRALVARHMGPVHELETATLLTLAAGESLSSVGARARQTTLGTLVCSRVRDAVGAEACIVNGGGIRASRDYAERLTYADVKAELPFDNEVVVARLPGSVLRDAIAASRANAPAEHGGYLQVDDRTLVDDATGAVTAVAGAPFDASRVYRVAMVRDLFLGMDHEQPLIDFARQFPNEIPHAGSGRELKCVLIDAFSASLWKQLGGFDRVDANHDGKVSEAELADAVARARGEAPSATTAHLVMHALDRDGDASVSREEADAVDKR